MLLLLGLLTFGPEPLCAQVPLRRSFVVGSGDGVVLPAVTDVDGSVAGVAILSPPAPALHLRHATGEVIEWGGEGEGPGEFREPISVASAGRRLIVLDMDTRRLSSWSPAGALLASRSIGATWARRIEMLGSDTLLEVFTPMQGRKAIVRLAGPRLDTLFAFPPVDPAALVRVAPRNGPSFTVTRPFSGGQYWAVLGEDMLAVWSPALRSIRVLAADGRELRRITPPATTLPVRAADRESWLAAAFPETFKGRTGLFDRTRALAREEVEFPRTFGPLLGVQGDRRGRLWILRTAPGGAGEVWQRLGVSGQVAESFRLPPGRALLAIGDTEALARAESEDGEPIVEGYRLSR